jgi:hypothetical protein
LGANSAGGRSESKRSGSATASTTPGYQPPQNQQPEIQPITTESGWTVQPPNWGVNACSASKPDPKADPKTDPSKVGKFILSLREGDNGKGDIAMLTYPDRTTTYQFEINRKNGDVKTTKKQEKEMALGAKGKQAKQTLAGNLKEAALIVRNGEQACLDVNAFHLEGGGGQIGRTSRHHWSGGFIATFGGPPDPYLVPAPYYFSGTPPYYTYGPNRETIVVHRGSGSPHPAPGGGGKKGR